MVRSFGTHLCAGTGPMRTKVTHEPDTCHLGLRLPAGAVLHGADSCTPTLPQEPCQDLWGGMELGRRHANSETFSPSRGSHCVPVSRGQLRSAPPRPLETLLPLRLFGGGYDQHPVSLWLLVNQKGRAGSRMSSVPFEIAGWDFSELSTCLRERHERVRCPKGMPDRFPAKSMLKYILIAKEAAMGWTWWSHLDRGQTGRVFTTDTSWSCPVLVFLTQAQGVWKPTPLPAIGSFPKTFPALGPSHSTSPVQQHKSRGWAGILQLAFPFRRWELFLCF